VRAADGRPRWGLYGAAGVLVRHLDGVAGEPWYFLARRSEHTHRGGTWAIPGGALDLGEKPLDAALREFSEEIGVRLDEFGYEVADVHQDDHGGWSYWTVIVDVAERFPSPTTLNWETSEATWVRASELQTLELFDAFKATLEHLGLLV
jgi:8-oxo-dGTP pyrophosphatase MutT (NUDIX family)